METALRQATDCEEDEMSKKEKSEFKAWFVKQHGKRPSKKPTFELQADYRQAQDLQNKCLLLLEKCYTYDAMQTSALYAWQAARKRDV